MRCYDGCPDSQLQAKIDADTRVEKSLAKRGMSVTYFPVEQGWMVFKGYHPVTEFHPSLQSAAHAALGQVPA